MYPAMKPTQLTGQEALLAPDGKQVRCLLDFWRWAYSDLVGNAERGALAEYLVACALELDHMPRISWDRYDLLTSEGISVEVKTSGYMQTWDQRSLSRLVFSISPTYGWDSKTNEFGREKKRQADIYVFCVHKHTCQETINPLDLSQWDFYLLPTVILNEKYPEQKSISLSALKDAGAEKCEYSRLKERISQLVKQAKGGVAFDHPV